MVQDFVHPQYHHKPIQASRVIKIPRDTRVLRPRELESPLRVWINMRRCSEVQNGKTCDSPLFRTPTKGMDANLRYAQETRCITLEFQVNRQMMLQEIKPWEMTMRFRMFSVLAIIGASASHIQTGSELVGSSFPNV